MDDVHQRQELVRNSIEYAASIGKTFLGNLGDLYGKAIYFTGQLPFNLDDLIKLLPPDIEGHNLAMNKPKFFANPETAYIVVGGDDFDKVEIDRYVTQMQPSVAFLPQEGFIDLLFGNSWWHAPTSSWLRGAEPVHILDLYTEYHPGLQYIKNLSDLNGFHWPSTQATATTTGGHDGIERKSVGWLKEEYGYSIRDNHGKPRSSEDRWRSLIKALQAGEKLQDIAEYIARLVRQAKRRKEPPAAALIAWQGDLKRLREQFYRGEGWWPNY